VLRLQKKEPKRQGSPEQQTSQLLMAMCRCRNSKTETHGRDARATTFGPALRQCSPGFRLHVCRSHEVSMAQAGESGLLAANTKCITHAKALASSSPQAFSSARRTSLARAVSVRSKAAVNAPHSTRFAKSKAAWQSRQRLERGGFSTALEQPQAAPGWSARLMAARWAGAVPQQPPTMRTPTARSFLAVSAICSGVAW